MLTLSVSHANNGSGPLAEIIGWIDWKNTYLDINTAITDIRVPLGNGLTLTFDIENTTLSGNGYALNPTTVPSIGSPFGTLKYTGIAGNAAYQIYAMYPTPSTTRFSLTNIRVTNVLGHSISNYAFVVADIETATNTTNPLAESQVYKTDGKPWNLLTWVGDLSNPTLSGIGTQVVTITGNNSDVTTSTGAPVVTTESPINLIIDITSTLGIQAFSIGIYILSQPQRGVNLFRR